MKVASRVCYAKRMRGDVWDERCAIRLDHFSNDLVQLFAEDADLTMLYLTDYANYPVATLVREYQRVDSPILWFGCTDLPHKQRSWDYIGLLEEVGPPDVEIVGVVQPYGTASLEDASLDDAMWEIVKMVRHEEAVKKVEERSRMQIVLDLMDSSRQKRVKEAWNAAVREVNGE